MIHIKNDDLMMSGDVKTLTKEITAAVLVLAEDLSDELKVSKKTAIHGILGTIAEQAKGEKEKK